MLLHPSYVLPIKVAGVLEKIGSVTNTEVV